MGNLSNATSGAMQGGQMGGSVGGPWGAVIGAVIGGVIGYNTVDPKEVALQAQRKYNEAVVNNTITDLFDREREQQVERMRTARALQSYQAQGKTQISTVRAGYGAADLIGASAQALAQAIDYQTTQALEATRFNYDVSFDNYLTNINQITNNGVNTMQKGLDVGQQQPVDIYGMFKAGKELYGGFKQMGSSGNSSSAGSAVSSSSSGSLGIS